MGACALSAEDERMLEQARARAEAQPERRAVILRLVRGYRDLASTPERDVEFERLRAVTLDKIRSALTFD